MTDEHEPRLFADDEAIRHVGEGLLACVLRREEWTHEAHLAACCWLAVERPDIVPERDLPDLIRRFNESVGRVNSDSEGYHETITQCFIRGVRAHLARIDPSLPLVAKVNGLLGSAEGKRDWPMCFYDPATLFSREARLGWVEPDLARLPELDDERGRGRRGFIWSVQRARRPRMGLPEGTRTFSAGGDTYFFTKKYVSPEKKVRVPRKAPHRSDLAHEAFA